MRFLMQSFYKVTIDIYAVVDDYFYIGFNKEKNSLLTLATNLKAFEKIQGLPRHLKNLSEQYSTEEFYQERQHFIKHAVHYIIKTN